MNVLDLASREFGPIGSGTWVGAISHTEQAMFGAPQVFRRRSCAHYVEVAVELGAVGIDDNPAGALRESKSQRRLAARSRTGNERERRFVDLYGHCDADSSRTAR